MAKRGRKTNEHRMQDQLDRMISVGEVIELLKEFPADAKFGVHGHFGEFHGMSKYDFTYTSGEHPQLVNYITPSGIWRDDTQKHVKAVLIDAPNIGPDPD